MSIELIAGDDSNTFPKGKAKSHAKGWEGHQTSSLPWKVVPLTIGAAATVTAEIDMRGYRNVTFVLPSGTPATGTVETAEASGGTFNDLYYDGTAVTFTIDGEAKSTLQCAGQGFIRVQLGGAYGSEVTGYVYLA